MTLRSLEEISTRWSQMEDLIEEEGPSALAEFLAVRYFEAMARKFKQYRKEIDELRAHELASEVVYELIKNDYRGIKRLEKNRGHLRGLLSKIIKKVIIDQIYRKKTEENLLEEFNIAEKQLDHWVDIYLDFESAIETMIEKRPLIAHPFIHHYLEGKSLSEIATQLNLTETAVKQRLFSARGWLAEALEDKTKDGT